MSVECRHVHAPKGESVGAVVASESESIRFGLKVGRASGPTALSLALDAVLGGGFELIIVRVPQPQTGGIPLDGNPARPNRARVFDCGTLLTYSGQAQSRHSQGIVRISEWSARDTKLVLDIFSGYRNHAARNPLLDASVVPLGYSEWAEEHVPLYPAGGCYRLVDEMGETEGFAALAIRDTMLSISLAGVVPASRGRGVYRRLLDAIEVEALALGVSDLRISTQLENTTPIRAWEERGWKLSLQEQILHIVSPSVER